MKRSAATAAIFIVASPIIACSTTSSESASSAAPPPLFNEIEYRFVGDRGEVDDEGWLLLWVASLEGDLEGEIRWWFEEPNPIADQEIAGASIAYYEGKWEIRIDGGACLEGRSAGKVVTRPGEDGIWDGHGVVTEGNKVFLHSKLSY